MAWPRACAVTNPSGETSATVGLLDDQNVPWLSRVKLVRVPFGNVTVATIEDCSFLVVSVSLLAVISKATGRGETTPIVIGPTSVRLSVSLKKPDWPTVVMPLRVQVTRTRKKPGSCGMLGIAKLPAASACTLRLRT